MFLGYAESRNTIIENPIDLFNVTEVLINMDLSFVSKRNMYLDALLGWPTYTNCTTEHVVSEDLKVGKRVFFPLNISALISRSYFAVIERLKPHLTTFHQFDKLSNIT